MWDKKIKNKSIPRNISISQHAEGKTFRLELGQNVDALDSYRVLAALCFESGLGVYKILFFPASGGGSSADITYIKFLNFLSFEPVFVDLINSRFNFETRVDDQSRVTHLIEVYTLAGGEFKLIVPERAEIKKRIIADFERRWPA